MFIGALIRLLWGEDGDELTRHPHKDASEMTWEESVTYGVLCVFLVCTAGMMSG